MIPHAMRAAALRVPTPRRLLMLAGACACALALGACGKMHECETYAATGGTYLCMNGLDYQVQISRQLNPYDAEDRWYLVGLSRAQATLLPGQAWYAVFIRITNYSAHPRVAPPLGHYWIVDTLAHLYRPLVVDATVNPYQYVGGVLGVGGAPHDAIIPHLDTPAQSGPVNGAMLLFKVNVVSYDNRPLTLFIQSPTDPHQTVREDLDV